MTLRRLSERSSDLCRAYRARLAAPAGFLSLLTRCSAPLLPALFHAGSAHGFCDLQRFSLRVQPANASRRRVPLVSLPFKVLSVGPQAAGTAEAARAMRCEPPTFSGAAREREALLPANVGQRAKMQELTRRDERGSCLTCCRCQGSPRPKQQTRPTPERSCGRAPRGAKPCMNTARRPRTCAPKRQDGAPRELESRARCRSTARRCPSSSSR